jgi:hypothetical protein
MTTSEDAPDLGASPPVVGSPGATAAGVTVGTGAGAATGDSAGELTAQLGQQLSRLVRDEIALARVEATQKAKQIGAGIGMFGAAGGMAFFGACCLVTAAILGFANVLQPWLAAIIVALILFLVAGLVALPGWKGITAKHPAVPQDSVDSLKADVSAVKEAAQR